MSKPWGHKITISIYIEGETPPELPIMAARGAEQELAQTYAPTIDFIGVASEKVQEKPKDQGAS